MLILGMHQNFEQKKKKQVFTNQAYVISICMIHMQLKYEEKKHMDATSNTYMHMHHGMYANRPNVDKCNPAYTAKLKTKSEITH